MRRGDGAKIIPTASAPASIASDTSAQLRAAAELNARGHRFNERDAGAAGSSERISASPIRKPRAPARRKRSTSARSRMPLSLIAKTSRAAPAGSTCSLTARSVIIVRRLRLLTPTNSTPERERALEVAHVVHLDEQRRARTRALPRARAHLLVAQPADDQQHAVGAVRGRLRHLIAGPRESLCATAAARSPRAPRPRNDRSPRK